MHTEHDIFACILDSHEHSTNHTRDNTLKLDIFDIGSLHSMGLAGGCLTIGENGAIEAVEHAFNNWFCREIIHLLLVRLHIEYSVESEVSVLLGHNFLKKKKEKR